MRICRWVVFGVAAALLCVPAVAFAEFSTMNGQKVTLDSDKAFPCKYENLVRGTYGKIPAGKYLWLVVHPVGSSGYWPQGTAIIPHPKTGAWTAKFWLGTRGTDRGKEFEVWLYLVDQAGHKAFLNYLEQGRATGKYPEKSLPEKAEGVDMIQVVKSTD